MSGISINPILTTNAAALFNVNSNGFVQGDAQDDPAVKFALCQGVYDPTATAPILGGNPILETIPSLAALALNMANVGATIVNALATGTYAHRINGFTVFNQAFAGITTPQSNCPSYQPGQSVNYYRGGSGARIPVRASAGLLATIVGGQPVNDLPCSWNFAEGYLDVYDGTNQFAFKVLRFSPAGNNLTATYNSGSNTANWITTENVALIQL